MNKQLPPIEERRKKISEFVGKIAGKLQDKNYNTGETIYRLQVKLENNDQIKEFRIYENKTDKLVWKGVINNEYISKRYLFTCDKIAHIFRLLKWKELPKE